MSPCRCDESLTRPRQLNVRFAQLLGYQGFKELQLVYRARMATATPGFDARIEALKNDLKTRKDTGSLGFLADLVVRAISRCTVLLDSSGGLSTHVANTIETDDVLLAVAFRFYATEVVNITEIVAKRGVPIVAISDTT
jgi:DNA-binding MurR/RpiR family transcriptional regulator